jgi:serine/threonine protein kinase
MKNKLIEYNIIEQFIREIKLHNSMNHPNIVRFYGFFEEKDSLFMILEYMNGGTMFEYLNSVGSLKIKEVVVFLRDVI